MVDLVSGGRRGGRRREGCEDFGGRRLRLKYEASNKDKVALAPVDNMNHA